MNYKSSGADARRPKRHCKLHVILSSCEVEWLDGAVAASGAWSRGLLITKAVRAGLAYPELKIQNNRRLRRVDALVANKLALRLKEVAAANNVNQQHLLRIFLFQYLIAARWERAEKQRESMISCN